MSAFAPTHATSPRADLRRALDDAVAGLGAGRAVLLLALDLDGFRRYNAAHGYEAGDALLERFAARLAGVEGQSFALGADAFALVVEGTPGQLWRRGAAALWALDPGSGGVELRCTFGAAVLADDAADTATALAVAEDRLADQRTRAPSVAERYGELILAILAAQQPQTSEHAFDVAALAAGVAARLGVDPHSTAASCAAPPSSTTSARSRSIRPSSTSRARSTTPSGRRCASTRSSATSCCSPRRRCAPSRRSCARPTSAGTARATPTASPARTSRSRRGSSRRATPTTR